MSSIHAPRREAPCGRMRSSTDIQVVLKDVPSASFALLSVHPLVSAGQFSKPHARPMGSPRIHRSSRSNRRDGRRRRWQERAAAPETAMKNLGRPPAAARAAAALDTASPPCACRRVPSAASGRRVHPHPPAPTRPPKTPASDRRAASAGGYIQTVVGARISVGCQRAPPAHERRAPPRHRRRPPRPPPPQRSRSATGTGDGGGAADAAAPAGTAGRGTPRPPHARAGSGQ